MIGRAEGSLSAVIGRAEGSLFDFEKKCNFPIRGAFLKDCDERSLFELEKQMERSNEGSLFDLGKKMEFFDEGSLFEKLR